MSSKFFAAVILLFILSMVNSDYTCNCYCPTSVTYAGYYTYSSSATICVTQNCANSCVGTFPSCTLINTYGSCRSNGTSGNSGNGGNSLTVPLISLMIGLTATFAQKFI